MRDKWDNVYTLLKQNPEHGISSINFSCRYDAEKRVRSSTESEKHSHAWERLGVFFSWMTRWEVRKSSIQIGNRVHILKIMLNRIWFSSYTHQWIVESGSEIFKTLRRLLWQCRKWVECLIYLCVYCNSLGREIGSKAFSVKINVLNTAKIESRDLGFWCQKWKWNGSEACAWINRRMVIPKLEEKV